MTEHDLQRVLTATWGGGEGLVLDNEERLLLVGWEVMTDYRINDAAAGFGLPAADFVFLDRGGVLVVAELKLSVRTPRECWSVLCQVSHRAHALRAAYTPANLEQAHRACLSGTHGRTSPEPGERTSTPESSVAGRVEVVVPPVVQDRHQQLYGHHHPVRVDHDRVRRLVLAQSYGPRWPAVRDVFDHDQPSARRAIDQYSSRRHTDLDRWLRLDPPARFVSPIEQAHV